MSSTGLRVLSVIVLLALLAGCGRANVVRRESGSQPPRSAQPATRAQSGSGAADAVVARGETLYGIAFRHGLDYREVARWNGIAAPYTIYPGQRIRLRPPGSSQASSQAAAPARASSGAAQASRSSRPTAGGARSTPAPAGQAAASTPSVPASAAPASRSATTATGASSAPPPVAASGPVAWRWPADGELVGRFVAGESTRQGIDIAGQSGQEVRAAADGVVVYSGSGLVGYGELIIIKHTDEWLSAYGHNRRRLVEEGQSVRGGQQVAEMGRSGASRDMLHFEIRRNGRPVDPLQHLPRR